MQAAATTSIKIILLDIAVGPVVVGFQGAGGGTADRTVTPAVTWSQIVQRLVISRPQITLTGPARRLKMKRFQSWCGPEARVRAKQQQMAQQQQQQGVGALEGVGVGGLD